MACEECAVRTIEKALMDRRFRVVNLPFSHCKCWRLMGNIGHLMSSRVLEKDAVMQSEGVAVQNCTAVPVPTCFA